MHEFGEHEDYRSGWRPLSRKDDPRVMSKTGVETLQKPSEIEENGAKEEQDSASQDVLGILGEIKTNLNSLTALVEDQSRKIAHLHSVLEERKTAGKKGILGLSWRK